MSLWRLHYQSIRYKLRKLLFVRMEEEGRMDMEEQRWERSGVVGGRKEGKEEGSERKRTVSDKL